MSENYVRFETNIKWYNIKDLVHIMLYQVIEQFLEKVNKGETNSDPVVADIDILNNNYGFAIYDHHMEDGTLIYLLDTKKALTVLVDEYNKEDVDKDIWYERASLFVRFLWD